MYENGKTHFERFLKRVWPFRDIIHQRVNIHMEGKWSPSYSYHLFSYQFFIYSIVCVDENCQATIVLAICSDFSESSQDGN